MYEYLPQIIITAVLIAVIPIARFAILKIVSRYAIISKILDSRAKHISKVFTILLNLTFLITIIIIWGVDPRNILVAMSSIFAVIGVAFFAQWSLLSNVTAGILIFFTSPFQIGDFVRIHDKDTPLDAEVIDILTFHTHFRTEDGEIVVFPNSLLMQKSISVIKSKKLEG